jgi:hypothetical protein
VAAGEKLLTEAASSLGPKELGLVAARVVDAIDPDGVAPVDEREHVERRFFHLKHRADGAWVGDFRLTPVVGQKLQALLDPLLSPHAARTTAADGGDGLVVEEVDRRSRGQRRHDAVEAIVDRLLRSADLPEAGGIPTTVVIVMSYTDYITAQTPTVAQNPTAQNPDAQNPTAQNPAAQNPAAQSCASQDHQGPQDRGPQGRSAKERGGLGVAHFADGSPLAVSTALRWADQAEVAWCVTTPQGAVLDLYRTRRIASPSQTVALIARDGGCSFPGCDTPPSWCERHHIVAWQDGGATNLDNLTLVCRYHHRHFETGGWTCQMNADGLPTWVPPRWVDRQRRPILHPRIIVNHWNPQDPLIL